MASGGGRAARVTLGLGLASAGFALGATPAGFALLAFAPVPVAAGLLNLCPVAPFWGGHFRGAAYCRRTTRGICRDRE